MSQHTTATEPADAKTVQTHIGMHLSQTWGVTKGFLGFPRGPAVKNSPAVQETWIQFLGQEDPLEEGMATHSSTLAGRIPHTEEPGGLLSMGSQRVGYN